MTRYARRVCKLGQSATGVAAIEFALVAPIILVLMTGIMQVGMALWAQAGLRNAVESGARFATIYPRPLDSNILDRIKMNEFGLDPNQITGPTLTHGTSNGVPYVDIAMSYNFAFHLLFVTNQSISLSYGRRVYQY